MGVWKDDREKIGALLLDFFGTKRNRNTLESMQYFGISGWEKWWQTEFALYLAQDEKQIDEWDMDHPFDVASRTGSAQERMAFDIGFRFKDRPSDEWYFLELRQDDNYRRCIDRMRNDAEKIFAGRKQSFDSIRVRYVGCAGVFLTTDEDEVMAHAEAAFKDVKIDADGLFLKLIGKHHLLLIF